MSEKLHPILVNGILETLQAIIIEGRYADKAIEYRLKLNKRWGSKDRGFVSGSVYDIIRYLEFYDFIAQNDPLSRSFLRLERLFAAYYWNKNGHLPTHPGKTGLSKDTLAERKIRVQSIIRIRESYPEWLWNKIMADYPVDHQEIMIALNKQAEVVLRANTLKCTAAELLKILVDETIVTTQSENSDALVLATRQSVFRTKAFQDGFFEVQDFASQQVAPFLEVQSSHLVIDACAGAGGKSLHLASLMGNKGRIIAMDIEEYKLAELKKRSKRAGVANIEIRLIESTKNIKRLHGKADRLLIDAPCSGSGTFRRNPDAKWKLRPERLEELIGIQTDILQRFSLMLKPEGKMVYATCSIIRAENEERVQTFLTSNPDFVLEEERYLLPHTFGYDGFYMARIKRIK